jgi:ElaB/YqjD/DUF883 family membrane-anchored ribosome-binding protein
MGERSDPVTGADTGYDRTRTASPATRTSSDELLRDIERTQREISLTIDEIQYRMSREHMKEKARDMGRRTTNKLIDTAREKPIALGLMAAGLFMLFRDRHSDDSEYYYRGRSIEPYRSWDEAGYDYDRYGYWETERYPRRGTSTTDERSTGDRAREVGERLSGSMHDAADKVSDVASDVREKTSETMHRAGERMERMRHDAGWQAQMARNRARSTFYDNPLAVGVAGLAFGALVGLLIPETEREHELMGETRDRLADRARDVIEEKSEQAKHVARAAGEAARETAKQEAKREGLTGGDTPQQIPTRPERR